MRNRTLLPLSIVTLLGAMLAPCLPSLAEEPIRVLMIDGDPGQRAAEAETRFLHIALSAGPDRFRITPKKPADLSDEQLADYDFLILANVADVSETLAPKLKTLLNGGGGLIVFLGDHVKPDSYNKVWYQDGKGILPAKLGDVVAHDQVTLDLQHIVYEPVKAFYKQHRLPVTVRKSYRLVVPDDESVRVVCPLSTGEPAIVDKQVGRGRVILFATTCDTDWTSWPLTPAYITVLYEAIQSLGPEFLLDPDRPARK